MDTESLDACDVQVAEQESSSLSHSMTGKASPSGVSDENAVGATVCWISSTDAARLRFEARSSASVANKVFIVFIVCIISTWVSLRGECFIFSLRDWKADLFLCVNDNYIRKAEMIPEAYVMSLVTSGHRMVVKDTVQVLVLEKN
jgi:hypothetical protein